MGCDYPVKKMNRNEFIKELHRRFPDLKENIDEAIRFINSEHPNRCITDSDYIINLIGILDEEIQGILIKMTCGEEHIIETDQPEIESIIFNGEQVYPPTEPVISDRGLVTDRNNVDICEKEIIIARALGEALGKTVKFRYNRDYLSGPRDDEIIVSLAFNASGNVITNNHAVYVIDDPEPELKGLGALFG